MSEELSIRRRRARRSPMRRHRVGASLAAGGAARASIPFPGIHFEDAESTRSRWISGSLALLLHAGVVGGMLAFAWLAPEELKEELIPVRLLNERPAEKTDPAPAPRAIAERRSAVFAPQPQAVQPQIVNPQVVARAAPQVAASKIEMNAVGQVAAPREVTRSAVVVDKVSAVQSVAQAQQGRVDVQATAGPALRGPIEVESPVGVSVGPRQVTNVGSTIGTGTVRLGDGSSVREGIASDRDVLGSPTGPRLADVNTAVGQGLMGAGGGGTGAGGVSLGDCFARPEVKQYWSSIQSRMYARWVLPPNVPGNQEVQLRFQLDAAGSAQNVQLVPGGDGRLGASAVDALRSAAPFPPMGDRVRCLAGAPIIGTFRNPLASGGVN
jgi:hypothetical protein